MIPQDRATDRPLPPPPWPRRWLRRGVLLLTALFACAVLGGPLAVVLEDNPSYGSWREARAGSTRPVGLAPPAGPGTPAVVQVYAARTWGARRAFAVHTWIAVKTAGAANYETLHVLGWRRGRGVPVVVREPGAPDRPWYGARPLLLADLRGAAAEPVIDAILEAAERYPWRYDYQAWPGPNSNTFTAWVGREVPALGLDLPATAIGKDYVGLGDVLGPSSSGSGYRASLYGLVALSVGREVGLELNLLGMHLELDLFDLALEIPGWGRIGPAPVAAPEG